MENIDWGQIASGFATPQMAPAPLPIDPRTAMAAMGAPPVNPNMQSPIAPEVLAKNAAARGIPPPPVDLAPAAAGPGSVGAALTGNTVPVPQPRPAGAGAPGAPMDIRSPAQQAGEGADQQGQKPGGLAEALKGVKAPASPELQRLGTPAAPKISTAIKGGDLQALLMALNAAPGASDYKLPSTLGAAIRK